MARGNQRNQSRKRNEEQKKKLNKTKTVVGKGGLSAKKEMDAAQMRAKQALADQKKEAEALAAAKKK
ncbi:hypothetical protein BO94DRAFT_583153 [Aspergillus sclerotioniger CBS 115572]|uniref:Small EDRK-rich factor-like N-terminal domain-containing protein n=1 Tax=Aspergillus sclerotioniger CBS 115572 TaxID=1450535 RepID=A0A317X5C0_9EURO|nr:hypothetical protein BO94DRAFT_583153 [Aspergillus sclerotioniger CBS 115572]PWY93796.1 hypothetical protein BO94DRAFT_583153 [Aspergillus sclerotioniger CBS 115572]